MSLYDSVRDLPLTIESYALEGLEQNVSSGFLRKSTVVHLRGSGEEGLGEDVTYEATEHDHAQAKGPFLPLSGEWTIDTFSAHLETLPLFDHEPDQHAYRDYRRWAYESAALDLALRQARSFARRRRSARSVEPLTFVVSMRLGEPSTTERLHAWLRLYPTSALQARRPARLVGRADRRARRHGGGRLRRLQGPVPRDERRHGCPTRLSTGGS